MQLFRIVDCSWKNFWYTLVESRHLRARDDEKDATLYGHKQEVTFLLESGTQGCKLEYLSIHISRRNFRIDFKDILSNNSTSGRLAACVKTRPTKRITNSNLMRFNQDSTRLD